MHTLADDLKRNILDNCITCGTCAKICPSIRIAQMGHIKPKVIQEHLYAFIKQPKADDIVSRRIDSCLECFKCVDVCPKDLNPLSFIELSKFIAFQNEHKPYTMARPADYQVHYQSLDNDLNKNEKSVLTQKSIHSAGKFVFFPGCNIYKDASRLRRVKAILDKIDPDIAFLPGLDFCCGDAYIFEGRLDLGENRYYDLRALGTSGPPNW